MKPKLVLTVGASCSGKSTFASNWVKEDFANRWELNRDEVRFSMFTGGDRDWTKYKFTRNRESLVTKFIEEQAEDYFLMGDSIIISDTNLNSKVRSKWEDWAVSHNYDIEYVTFEETWDTLRKRNQQREGGISESVLWDQYLRMRDYLNYSVYTYNGKRKAAIVDIDGTIAKVNGRGFFDWDKVDTDTPRKVIINIVKSLETLDYSIIFLSGRCESCKDLTMKWLTENVKLKQYVKLYMRPQEDMRKDYVVKKEIYDNIKDKWDIDTVIDDRPQVLRLWEELKIPNIINVGGSLHKEF